MSTVCNMHVWLRSQIERIKELCLSILNRQLKFSSPVLVWFVASSGPKIKGPVGGVDLMRRLIEASLDVNGAPISLLSNSGVWARTLRDIEPSADTFIFLLFADIETVAGENKDPGFIFTAVTQTETLGVLYRLGKDTEGSFYCMEVNSGEFSPPGWQEVSVPTLRD